MESGITVIGHKIETGVSVKRPLVTKILGTIIISGVNPLTFGHVNPFLPTGNLGNEESLLLKVWTSSALRDNLVTVFGYLLFQGKWPNNFHTYSALMLLYSNLRHRQIFTIDLLPALLQASTESPSGQMLILLNKLSKIVPRYLISAVEEVTISASKNQQLIDNLMQPEGGPLVVDFLAGINGSHIITAIKPIVLGNNNEEKEVTELLGSTFSQIFASIYNGKLQLSQPLFAGILSHIPTNHLNPRGEEFMRVLIEYLRSQPIQNWSLIVGKLNDFERKFPYDFVKRIIKSISMSTDISESIREAASTVVDYLQEPQVAFSNPYFNVLSPIISRPTIDFPSLLEAITYPEFPADVVDVKNRIVYYIQHGYLDIDLITKGFMRYDHVKPIDLVIAMLTRMTTTMPNLPPEIMSSVKSLTVHLIFKEFSCNMASTIPSDLVDLYLLTAAFKSPSLPTYFLTAIDEVVIPIIKALPDELVSILSTMPLQLCTQPRTCLLNVLSKVKITYPLKIKPFLHILQPFLEFSDTLLKVPLPSFLWENVIPGEKVNNTNSTYIIPPTSVPEPKLPPFPTDEPHNPENQGPSYPLPTPPNTNTSEQEPEPSLETIFHRPEIWSILVSISTPPENVPFPLPSPTQEGLPVPPGISLDHLLPAPLPGTQEFYLLRPLRLLLALPELTKQLYKIIKVEDYSTRGELLRAVLNFLLEIRIIQELPGLSEYIKTYLHQLELAGSKNPLEIYWGGLLSALPLPETQNEIKRYEVIKTFLEGNVSSYIGLSFNLKAFRVKGQLLKALLEFLMTVQEIKGNQELFACIQYYVDRVLLQGFGAQPIEYVIATHTTTTTAVVDLTSTFAALDTNRFDANAKTAFDNMVKYFTQGNRFQGFNFKKYQTKGAFLKALFEFIMESNDTSESMKNSFKILIPYITMTGPGEEPVKYN